MQTKQTKPNNIKPPIPKRDRILRKQPETPPFSRQQWWDPKSSDTVNAAADVLAVLAGLCRAHPEKIRNGELEMTESLLAHFTSAGSGTVIFTLEYLRSIGTITLRPSTDCKFLVSRGDKAHWIGLKPGVLERLNHSDSGEEQRVQIPAENHQIERADP